MQATSLAALPVQVTGADGAAENAGAGQGIRISSSQQAKTRDSLFTTILQKGITLRSAGSGADETGTTPAPDDGTKSGDETIDVCSLLMQLTMIGAAPLTAGSDGGTETAGTAESSVIHGLPGVIAEHPELADPNLTNGMNLTGKLNAASVILQNGVSKAGEVLTGIAASRTAISNDTPSAEAVAGAGQAGTVLSGIVSALQGELAQNTAAQSASDATQQTAAAAAQAQVTQTASATAAGAIGNAVQNDIAGDVAQANIQAAQNGRPAPTAVTSAADTARTENTSASDTSGPAPVSDAGQAITAAVLKDPEGAFTGDRESDTGRGLSLRGKDNEYPDAAGSLMAGISGGKFAGTLMAEKTAAEAAAAAEKALNRLGEDIRALRGGAHEIRIILEPESLGTLIISVVKTENGVTAKIKSEDKSVVAAISDQLQKLITGMENKGIHLEDVDVIYSQTEQNRGFGQNGFTQSGGGSHRGYAASPGQSQSSDTPAEDIFTGYYSEGPGGGSTVDYTV